jgi:hypothetical protein
MWQHSFPVDKLCATADYNEGHIWDTFEGISHNEIEGYYYNFSTLPFRLQTHYLIFLDFRT